MDYACSVTIASSVVAVEGFRDNHININFTFYPPEPQYTFSTMASVRKDQIDIIIGKMSGLLRRMDDVSKEEEKLNKERDKSKTLEIYIGNENSILICTGYLYCGEDYYIRIGDRIIPFTER